MNASVLLFVVFAVCAVQAHMTIWTPSMFGREASNPTSDWLAQPLQNYNFTDWWMHGNRTINDPPAAGQISNLVAGGTIDFEITGNKWWTSMGNGLCVTNSTNPREPPVPWDNGWNGKCSANVHAPSRGDVASCALGIAYKSAILNVFPSDFTVFSVAYDCIARQLQNFDIPALPACPPGGCICSWFWIHKSIGGTDQMYMTPFRCNVTNPTTRTIGTPVPPVRCDGQPACSLFPNWGTKTTVCNKVQQPMYWANNQGNNMGNPTNAQCAPTYAAEYGFPDGAQHQIFTNTVTFPNSVGDTLISTGTNSISSNPYSVITSATGRYTVTAQGDGNVVLYDGNGNPHWASNTAGVAGTAPYKLTVQTNGNVQLTDAHNVVWWQTNTGGQGCAPYKLKVRDVNRFYLADCNSTPLWSANTY